MSRAGYTDWLFITSRKLKTLPNLYPFKEGIVGSGNGQKFAEFQKFSIDEKLDYLYLEIQQQKSDLKWYVTIISGVATAAFYFGKEAVKALFAKGTSGG